MTGCEFVFNIKYSI